MRRLLPLLTLAALLGSGCAYTVRVTATQGATALQVPNGDVLYTPTDVRVTAWPLGSRKLVATAPGYRPVTVDLAPRAVGAPWWPVFHPAAAFRGGPRRAVEISLVPEHGPVGTWTEGDVPTP